jgi:hypothetical protein
MTCGWRVVACLLAFTAWGCDNDKFDHLEYHGISAPRGTLDLGPGSIRIARGTAVKAGVYGIDTDDDLIDGFDLESANSAVFRVDPGPNSGEWVFSGVEVGSTELDVTSDHRTVGSVPVDVVAE